MNTLKVAIKTELGVEKYAPRCDDSKIFTKLLRATSLSTRDIELIKKLGYKFEVVNDQPKEL